MSKLCLIIVVFTVSYIKCSRILGIFPTPSVSHQIVYHTVIKELARRGHEVVTISPNPIADKNVSNLREINMTKAYDMWRTTFNFALGRQLGYGAKEYTYGLFEGMIHICDHILNIPEVTEIIHNKSEYFNLVMVEWIFCPNMAVFSHRFSAPLVGIASFHAFITGHDNVGNPTHPVYTPDFFLPYSDDLNFWERLYSTYYNFWFRWYYYFDLIPKEDNIARRYFGDNIPYLTDIINNLSLLLTNTHPILGGPRPLVPTTIEIGGTGLHIKPNKPLPKHLQKYLDEAEEGVIYFSLGSNVRSVALSDEKRNAILSAFAEMPFKILWKWESDTLESLPKNVKIQKWFPQQDILRHKNIKAFFTQGGLQSFEEAVLNKVPLVAMPFFADQDYNVNKMVHLGVAVSIEVNTLTKTDVKEALYTVINNTKYRKRITEISRMVYDQPMKSLDQAIWWIEYVLRHKGTKHLRSPAVQAPIYKHFFLDIICFLIVCCAVTLYVVYQFYKIIMNYLKERKRETKVKKN